MPSHIGVHGNERVADKTARKALLADIYNTKIPYTDLKSIINKFIVDKWQKSWDDQILNKLWQVTEEIEKKKWYSLDFAQAIPTLPTHTPYKEKTPQYEQCAKYPSQSNTFS